MPTFATPQRQSKIGILVLFFHTLQQYGRAFLPILFISLYKFDEWNPVLVIGAIVLILAIVAIIAYLQYQNFTFFLDDANNEFIISEGVLNKTRTVIQLNKIQQVNITQTIIQRIIGVYALDVDTAGSDKKEGRIKAVSHNLALLLKARLLENSVATDSKPIADSAEDFQVPEKPFITIGFPSLLKFGITSNYLKSFGLIIAFIATIYENVSHYAEYSKFEKPEIPRFFIRQAAYETILMIVAFMFVAVIVINVLRTVFRYFNYTVTRQSGSLLLSFGLLNTKSTIVKPEKVQITSVSQNYFQKKMNLLELRIRQATSGHKEEKKSAIEIPGCDAAERDAIFNLLFQTIPQKGAMLKPNFRKLGFSIFLLIIVPLAVLYAIAHYAEPRFFDYGYFALIYVFFALLVLCFSFRNYRLYISDKFIIKQSGAWDIANEIIEPGKIQAISTSQLFWHKSLNIGSITIHTAGGNIGFQLGNFETIKSNVNKWLYELERSDSNWM